MNSITSHKSAQIRFEEASVEISFLHRLLAEERGDGGFERRGQGQGRGGGETQS